MIYLGLFLALASLPGWTSAAIPAGWAALSISLPIVAWHRHPITWGHVAMGVFLVYVFASISWSVEPLDGIYRLWQFCLIGGCFWLGTVREPKPILVGLAYGFMISSIIAIGQWYGVEFVVRYNWNNYPGLYFSGVFAGAIGSLLFIALLCEGLWFHAIGCVPGIVLASLYSRASIPVILVGLAALWLRKAWLIPVCCVIILTLTLASTHNSDIERKAIWSASYGLLTWFGWGAGSFVDLFVTTPFGVTRAEHAHNDYLQLIFEFGLGSVLWLGIWIALCFQTYTKYWPLFASFTILSLFFFPLYTPIPVAIFALCAGTAVRDWSSLRDLLHSLRHLRLLRKATPVVSVPLPT